MSNKPSAKDRRIKALESALERMLKMHGKVCEEINWSSTFFSAETLKEMNEAPTEAERVLKPLDVNGVVKETYKELGKNDPDAMPPYKEGDQVVYITNDEARFHNDHGDSLIVERCYFDDMENCWYVKPTDFGGFHGPAHYFKSKKEAVRLIEKLFETTS